MTIMQEQILQSFEVFLKTNELGKTDASNINQILAMMDKQGCIDKQKILTKVFSSANNADDSYRNLISRTKSAIKNAINSAEPKTKDILSGIELQNLKATNTSKACLQLKANYTNPDIVPDINSRYDTDDFQKNKASQADSKDSKDDLLIFISYSKENITDINHFKDIFEAKKQKINNRNVRIWTMQDLTFGGSFHEQIEQSLKECDFALAALSQHFLESDYIKDVEANFLLSEKKLLLFGLDKKIDGRTNTVDNFFTTMSKRFNSDPVHQQTLKQQVCYLTDGSGGFFTDCNTSKRRDDFVDKVIAQLEDVIQKAEVTTNNTEASYPNPQMDTRSCDYQTDDYHKAKGKSIDFKDNTESLNEEKTKISAPSEVDLITDMLAWVEDDKSSVYALLGDYGMGKTFSCRVFSEKLSKKENAAKPFYIDLRNTPTLITEKGIIRQPYLEEIIQDELRRQNIKQQAQWYIDEAQNGDLIFIFDGLDEKLVHYTHDMRAQFLAELMRVFPNDISKNQSKVKVILSCRSHHFEDLKSQSNFFRDLGRGDVKHSDYRAMEILPFNELQIKSLLEKQLSTDDFIKITDLINDNRYLKNLAKRPFLLNKMAHTLPKLQELSQQGKTINASSIYQALINDALDRDEGKHILSLRHKKSLLQDLSAQLWQDSTQILNIDDLNDWYQTWLDRANLRSQYDNSSVVDSSVINKKLEQDLRNSTLLVRFNDDDFGFTHSSMQEYFLSRWLWKQWQKTQIIKLDKPISALTKQFIIDACVNLPTTQLNEILANTFVLVTDTKVASLALDIVAELEEAGKVLKFKTITLKQLSINNFKVSGLQVEQLKLTDCNFPASQWQTVFIDNINLKKSNINQAVWQSCTINNWQHDAKVNDNEIALNSGVYQLSFAECQLGFEVNSYTSTLDWHLPGKPKQPISEAMLALAKMDCLTSGHTNTVLSPQFSPDGQSIVSTSREICIWRLTGELQALWTNDYQIQAENNVITKIKGTADAWKQVNFSNGKQTLNIDELDIFELV